MYPRNPSRGKNKTQGAGRSRKQGFKDHNIDRQILALHQAIGQKVLQQPTLADQVKQTLEDRLAAGKIRYGAYITWHSILDMLDEPETFYHALTDMSPKMCQLRRKTPFVGVLTEEERQAALDNAACGTTSIETLL